MFSLLLSWAFFSWVARDAGKCNLVTIPPSLMPVDLCNGSGWFVGLEGNVGIVACSDYDIYISFDESPNEFVHATSVEELHQFVTL